MFQDLQEESKKAQEQRMEFLTQLHSADSSRQALEERLADLQKQNTQLQVGRLRLKKDTRLSSKHASIAAGGPGNGEKAQ